MSHAPPQINVHRPKANDAVSEQRSIRSNRSSNRPHSASGGQGRGRGGPGTSGSTGGRKPGPADAKKSPGHSPTGKDKKHDSLASLRLDGIVIGWPDKRLEDAPEVVLVRKISQEEKKNQYGTTICARFKHCFQVVQVQFKNKIQDNSGLLVNFKPIEARTWHTLEYVDHLALNYSTGKTLKVPLVVGAATSNNSLRDDASSAKGSSMGGSRRGSTGGYGTSNRKKARHELLSDFYEVSHNALKKLQRGIYGYKNIIFTLTYTRYSENLLTESEKKLTKGKSIIGSYMWVLVHALQQMQDDPEVESMQNSSRVNAAMHELAIEMVLLLNLSFQTWDEVVYSFGALEHVHKKTEDVFHRQTLNFQTLAAPDPETANKATLHLKKFRRGDMELEDLKNFRYDPYSTLMNWKKGGSGTSRILFKFNYTDISQLWHGFDPLSAAKKIATLRDLLTYVRLILESVKESAQEIVKTLLKPAEHSHTSPQSTPHSHGQQKQQPFHDPNKLGVNTRASTNEVTNYEEGVEKMDEILGKKLFNIEWRAEEIADLFETDKIFLDDMDVLTLGAAVTRAILHEARHQIHVSYETCRLLDFKEFGNLPPYEKIYHKLKEEHKEHHHGHHHLYLQYAHHNKKFTKGSFVSNAYDIEENNLELRNVSGLFRTSPYHDILVALPVYTNLIALTLQESETVFTPSSEKLLANYKDPVHGPDSN